MLSQVQRQCNGLMPRTKVVDSKRRTPVTVKKHTYIRGDIFIPLYKVTEHQKTLFTRVTSSSQSKSLELSQFKSGVEVFHSLVRQPVTRSLPFRPVMRLKSSQLKKSVVTN